MPRIRVEDPIGKKIKNVYCSNTRMRNCVEFDTDEGWVRCLDTNQEGDFYLNTKGNDWATREYRGHITFTWKSQSPSVPPRPTFGEVGSLMRDLAKDAELCASAMSLQHAAYHHGIRRQEADFYNAAYEGWPEAIQRAQASEALNVKMAQVLEAVLDTFGVIERPMPMVKATLREVESVLAAYKGVDE